MEKEIRREKKKNWIMYRQNLEAYKKRKRKDPPSKEEDYTASMLHGRGKRVEGNVAKKKGK